MTDSQISKPTGNQQLAVLSLQPFYGGSHQQFNDGWKRHSQHHWTTLALPDRHWKWRMRHAPLEFAQQINALRSKGENWDVVVCTDMLDLATMKGLCADWWPTVVYFHENQFEYPNQTQSAFDHHYSFTNLTSAVAADEVWFNSDFNRQSMIAGIERLSARFPDYSPQSYVDSILQKSHIQSPGIELPRLDTTATSVDGPIKILWAARWEHDKGPNLLEEILTLLSACPYDFEISVVGQQFRRQPEAFDRIQKQFAANINRWGFVERSEYDRLLAQSDVFLSTADHEFFGLSFVEATSNNAWPVVPDRLAYPELLQTIESAPQFKSYTLYQSAEEAMHCICHVAGNRIEASKDAAVAGEVFRDRYRWQTRAAEMDQRLADLVNTK